MLLYVSDAAEPSNIFPTVDMVFDNGQKLSLAPENYLFQVKNYSWLLIWVLVFSITLWIRVWLHGIMCGVGVIYASLTKMRASGWFIYYLFICLFISLRLIFFSFSIDIVVIKVCGIAKHTELTASSLLWIFWIINSALEGAWCILSGNFWEWKWWNYSSRGYGFFIVQMIFPKPNFFYLFINISHFSMTVFLL